MKIKRKVLVSILCLMFLFSVTGMAFAAPQDGYYANGHRYDLTLDVTDAAYLTYLEDMAAIDFDFSKVIIVSDNKFAAVQAAVDAGSIPEVLQPNAHEQVGTAIPSTVIPIANNGTVGPGEIVSDTLEELVLESIAITTPADKLVYNVGDQLDITGMVVTGYYDDGSSKVLPMTEANVTGFDSSAAVASQTLTVTVEGKTAEYTVEIKEAVGPPVTATSLIETAIANFVPVKGEGTFTGIVPGVKVAGDVTIDNVKMVPATTTINAAKEESSILTVKITPMVQTTDKDVTAAAFPFAEIISGSGVGAELVSTGIVSEDANYYYIQLTEVNCPDSIMAIFNAAANVNSSYGMELSNQKLSCQIKVSKTTGRVVSVNDIIVTGAIEVTKSTLNLANGTYANTFNCTSITITN